MQVPEQDLSSAACSNRGIWSEGLQACACYGCSAGLLCETQLAEAACALDVSSGTPVLFGARGGLVLRFSCNSVDVKKFAKCKEKERYILAAAQRMTDEAVLGCFLGFRL